MFDEIQKTTALQFAQSLAARDYDAALSLSSDDIKTRITADKLGKDFEAIIPLSWGEVDPIEMVGGDAFPFIYIELGGDVYSEAIIVHSFSNQGGEIKIANFELGRP